MQCKLFTWTMWQFVTPCSVVAPPHLWPDQWLLFPLSKTGIPVQPLVASFSPPEPFQHVPCVQIAVAYKAAMSVLTSKTKKMDQKFWQNGRLLTLSISSSVSCKVLASVSIQFWMSLVLTSSLVSLSCCVQRVRFSTVTKTIRVVTVQLWHRS